MTPFMINKVVFIYIKERKVLFVRSRGKDSFYTVGGKQEIGETDQQSLIREVKEELNIDLISDTIEYMTTFEDLADGKENTTVRLKCFKASFNGTPTPTSEIEELGWLNTKNCNKTTPTGKKVIDWLYAENLID